MGYIKKLKNNELVGGTDKTTIYPVTSTKAVFEEVTEGDKSSFKSQETINREQQDILDDHEERIQTAEAEDIKSITINGSTKKFEVDSKNNVDLTIYTVDNDPEMPSIADSVRDLRDVVGTSEEVLPSSHKVRIERLEGGEGVFSSVENKIKTKVDSINSSYQDNDNEYVKYSMTQTSGKVTDFNIDETSLKNAITSLNTSISGDNIVIRSGSTPSGTGEAGKIYRYVNSSNNTYTDYMYSGGNWVILATHDTSNEQSQVAYYTCTATGSGAQATKQFISNGSLEYTPSSGGHIKILMGEANTATGTIYLQYNTDSTNTKKPLYYNGEPVSPGNTWEENEVISVYFDGTNYQASNAQGGSNKKIDAYLLGDLRTLAIGETYSKDEAIKTSDKQLLRMSKPIETVNLSEVVHKGSIYTDGTNTYEADDNITEFNPNTEYSSGDYALGSRSVVTIAVTAASTEGTISVTIGDTTADITASTNAETTAASIAALTVEGWTLAADGSNVIATCNTIGNNTLSVSYTDTDSTGTTLTDTTVAGTSVIRKYDGSTWSNATVAGMVTDGIYVERDVAWLATNAVRQNDIVQDLYSVEKKTLTPVKNLFSVWNTSFYPKDSSSSSVSCFIYRYQPTIATNTVATRRTKTSSATVLSGITLNKTLVDGQRYNLKFDYVNNAADDIYIDIRNSTRQQAWRVATIKLGTGSVDFDFVGDSSMHYIMVGLVAAAPTDKYVYLKNITLSKLENTTQNEIKNIWKTTGVRYYIPDESQWNPGRAKIANGTVKTDVNNSYFCEIDLTDVKSIYAYIPASTASLYGPCFYKADGTFISGITKTSGGWFTIQVPEGAALMRYDRYGSFDGKYLLFYYDKPETGTTSSSYKVPMEVGYIISVGVNSKDSYDATTATGYDAGGGYAFASELGEYSFWRNVGMIEVEDGTYTIAFDKGDICFVFLYDNNRTFISRTVYGNNAGDMISSVTINTSNVKYIRFIIAKKSETFPTAPAYIRMSEPKCTITGSFTNGLKIAKLKQQKQLTNSSCDYFNIPVWIENTFSTNSTAHSNQDTGEWHIDFGRIMFPPNYDPDGEPTRLIIYSHGGDPRYNPVYDGDKIGGEDAYVVNNFHPTHITPAVFLAEGYAVMDIDGCFCQFNTKRIDDVLIQSGRHIANCYNAAYNFIVNNYNIRKDGVLLGGRSWGGNRSMQIIAWSKIPILAAALHVPYVNEAYFWQVGHRIAFAKSAGFTNYESVGNGAITDEQIEILKENYPKLLRTSPLLAACHIPKSEFFEVKVEDDTYDEQGRITQKIRYTMNKKVVTTYTYDEQGVATESETSTEDYNTWRLHRFDNQAAKFNTPIKLWGCAGDPTANPDVHAKLLYNAAANGGTDIELRLLSGGSHNPISGSGAITVNTYVTKYGQTLTNVPVFYVETIRFWRRYEQN